MLIKNYAFPWGIYIGDLIKNNHTIPLCLDSQQGGICILFDDNSENIANNFIENISLKIFEVMPLNSIKVNIFDFGKSRFMKLSALKKANLYSVYYSKNMASKRFDILDELESERYHEVLSYETPTLSEYNKVVDEKEKYYLLLININDFPDEITSVKQIKNFFSSSFDAGFYTILFGTKEVLDSKSKSTQAILKQFQHINIKNGQFDISKKLFEFPKLLKHCEFEYLNDNKERIIKKILKEHTKEQREDLEQDFLHIPIGSVGRKKLYFSMGLKSQNYHAFIAGMTGMGKTNLLNSIIVNIAQNYTAKEVELYLMDYKPSGAEFIIFKNHPNCKKLFLENQDTAPAFNMLKEFQQEMYKRGEILNGTNIDEYNRKSPNSIIPRKILIIDEVQRMFSGNYSNYEAFNELIIDIIKAGRSNGLHLILTTQSLQEINMKKSVMGQIPLKLSFRLNDSFDAMKIFNENKEAIKKVIKLKKYQFVYSDFNKTVVAKSDYLNKDEIDTILTNVRMDRDDDDEMVSPIIIKNSTIKYDEDKKAVFSFKLNSSSKLNSKTNNYTSKKVVENE